MEVISSSSEGTRSESNPNNSRSRAVRECAGTSQMFQRIWSLDDEIVILKGMMKYSSEKKLDPMLNLDDFFNFIKGDLKLNCTQKQLLSKIRSLQRKYKKNKRKLENGGKGIRMAGEHDQEVYELSKNVWENPDALGRKRRAGRPRGSGGKRGGSEEGTAEPEVEPAEVEREEGENTSCGVEEGVSRAWAELYGGEREWKKLRVEDVELYYKKLEEKLEQTRLVLNFLNSQRQC